MSNLILGFLPGLGTGELILILVVILILFGAKKIPEFARGLGNGIREFRSATQNVKQEIEREVEGNHRNPQANNSQVKENVG